MTKITNGSFPFLIIPHEDLNRTPHWKISRSHWQHCILTIKMSSVFHFPLFCFFLSFFFLASLPTLPNVDLSVLPPPWASFPLQMNLLHPLHTPLGTSLGITYVCFPHTHALPSWIFVSSPLFREQNSTSFYVQLRPRARGKLNCFSFPFLFFALCESEAQSRQL